MWYKLSKLLGRSQGIFYRNSLTLVVVPSKHAYMVADTEGIHVVRLNPHLRQNYSIFMKNFKQNQHKLSNNHVQFSNRNLICKFEPPSKKSWIRPCFYHLFYFIYMGQPIWDPSGTGLHCLYGSHMGTI